jgi:dipeptidyl-peptidase 4
MRSIISMRFAIIAVIFVCISTLSYSQTKQISIDDIYKKYLFFPNSIDEIRSMKDGLYYTTLEDGIRITRWKYASGEKVDDIFSAENSVLKKINDYTFSNDECLILLSTDKERIYRRSFRASYYVYNIAKKEIVPLSPGGKQQLATFSPDGKKVAFVRENNLYITDLSSSVETQITFDGKINSVINGTTDWVYEEEFGFERGFAWSPDSKKLAFYRFDESGVREFSLTMYKDLYPNEVKFKYPKAGEANSVVSILCYDLETGKSVTLDTGGEKDQYIGRIFWTKDPNKLSILRLNRLQNRMDILHAEALTGKSELVFTEKNEKFINEPSDNSVIYLPDGQSFLFQSERDGWLHFYVFNFAKNETRLITPGEFDISGYIGFNEKTGTLYFLSHEKGALVQDVYSVGIDGKGKKRISTEEGWNEAEFSSTFRYYILQHSSADVPSKYTLFDEKGKAIRVLEDNSDLSGRMKEFGFVKHEFLTIPNDDGILMNAWIMKPADFDPMKKYPVFMYVYGGPQSQSVLNSYSISDTWDQILVQKGYIVACVDGRGTDGRGEAFRKSTYMQLGKYETLDQIAAAHWLGKLPYIDASRIGIFGWSYGGYMSLNCLFQGADAFKMAISVAPVTNWRYYDSVYTERYMRTPQENASGYDDNSPINYVKLMKGKLLLVHGMADDNVHFQNSVELVQKLIEFNKQFDMQFYPNRNHGIYGGNSTIHLYNKMTDFITENL